MVGSRHKREAAEEAVKLVKDGMIVGLGTGSTADFATEALGRRVSWGLRITGVPTSVATEMLARKCGIPILPYEEFVGKRMRADIDIDGADRVDPEGNLIKGGGGCHTREKVVAKASRKFVVIVDEGKLSNKLFTFPVAVEVAPGVVKSVSKALSKYGKCKLRMAGGAADCAVWRSENRTFRRSLQKAVFITDNSNNILDLSVSKSVGEPSRLEVDINGIPGVIDNGIFALRKPDVVLVGCSDRLIQWAQAKERKRSSQRESKKKRR